MKKLIKFEKDGCNPCNMVSAWLDKRNVEYEKINAFNDPMKAAAGNVGTKSEKRAYINFNGRRCRDCQNSRI